jgi:hypothetical protein
MIIIADSNIFMSALINPNGLVASILSEKKRIQFIVPDYLITEVTEHLPTIATRLKNNKTAKQLLDAFKQLLEGITVVQEKDIEKPFVAKAEEIVADIDEDDMHFIALHLQIRHKIWTMDNRLKKGLTAKGYGHFFISEEKMIASTYKKHLPKGD